MSIVQLWDQYSNLSIEEMQLLAQIGRVGIYQSIMNKLESLLGFDHKCVGYSHLKMRKTNKECAITYEVKKKKGK